MTLRSWNSDAFRRWAARHGIDTRRTPTKHHRGAGLAERMIGTLCERMRRMLNGSTEGWPGVVDGAVHAINNSWSSAIGTTPSMLMRGLDRNGVIAQEDEVRQAWELARTKQLGSKAYERNRFEWKHKRRSKGLRLGDRVLMISHGRQYHPLKKLGPKRIGPFTVEEQRSDSTRIIRRPGLGKPPILAHSSQLTRYHL